MNANTSTVQQHICLLHGWLSTLLPVNGDYAVIIHSDRDCANLIPKSKGRDISWQDRFFCTNLTDSDIICGTSNKKLETCLAAVLKEIKPKAVLILGSCMSLLINDNAEALARKYQKISGHPVTYKNTSGFSFKEPKEVIDECGLFLLELAAGDKQIKKKALTINLIGFDYDTNSFLYENTQGGASLKALRNDLLTLGGIEINTVLNPCALFSEWEKAKNAQVNITVDKNIYVRTCAYLLEKYNIPTLETPYPSGLINTLAFFEIIISSLKLDKHKCYDRINAKLNKARSCHKKYQQLLKKKKLLYNISTSVDFSVTNSAKEGLLYLGLFRELNLDIEILVQGNPEKENSRRTKKVLRNLCVNEPITLFGHCGDVYKFFPKKSRALFIGSKMFKEQTDRFGHAQLNFPELKLGLDNYQTNLKKIAGKYNK
jgi:nitrogenase molybdenum-iron protein alpha/beta subunit